MESPLLERPSVIVGYPSPAPSAHGSSVLSGSLASSASSGVEERGRDSALVAGDARHCWPARGVWAKSAPSRSFTRVSLPLSACGPPTDESPSAVRVSSILQRTSSRISESCGLFKSLVPNEWLNLDAHREHELVTSTFCSE